MSFFLCIEKRRLLLYEVSPFGHKLLFAGKDLVDQHGHQHDDADEHEDGQHSDAHILEHFDKPVRIEGQFDIAEIKESKGI